MNVNSAIGGLLSHIKDVTLSSFSILDMFIYDEQLDFSRRAKQYITRESVFQQVEGGTQNDWVFIIWNRGDLQTNSTSHNRPLSVSVGTIDPNLIDSEVKMRMASMEIEMKIITNNIDLAERIEEYLHVECGETTTYQADYGVLGIMECSADAESSTSFEKEEIESHGSVISVGLNSTISFPVFLGINPANTIGTIDYNIYESINADYNSNLLSSGNV